MLTEQTSPKNNVRFISNRFQKKKSNDQIVRHDEIKPPYVFQEVEDDDADDDESFSEDWSTSSDEEIFLENYTTKKNVTPSINGNNRASDSFTLRPTKQNFNHLGILFERSDESCVSSPATVTRDESVSPPINPTNHFLLIDDVTNSPPVEIQPISDEITIHTVSSTNQLSDAGESPINSNHSDMRNDIATNTHTIDSVADVRETHTQSSVFDWSTIDNCKPISSSLLIFNKRTPRFHNKNNSNHFVDCEPLPLITDFSHIAKDEEMQKGYPSAKKPEIPKKPNREQLVKQPEAELVTDLDDHKPTNEGNNNHTEPTGSYFKNQMFKNYSKTDLKVNHRFEKKTDSKKPEADPKPYDKDSPSRRSQEITGSVMKMDKTIDRVANNIVKIDNVLDKMAMFNRGVMNNLELMSDAELTSDFETQSIGAQTDSPLTTFRDTKPQKSFPKQMDLSSSSESSTEKETDSDDSSLQKPSPVHQVVKKQSPPRTSSPPEVSLQGQPKLQPKTVANCKSLYQHDSDLSSLPESSICEEPEKRQIPEQVAYFQRQIQKSARHVKKPRNIELPKRLVVEEDPRTKHSSTVTPVPKPRNSIDGTLTRRMSESPESSSSHEYQKTLSNSNNHFQSTSSPVNSDSGSFRSLNSSNNNFEQRYQKASTSGRYSSKHQSGTVPKIRNKEDVEVASLSGKYDPNRNSMNRFMKQSRSYNSLNTINSQMDNEGLRAGSVSALNNNGNTQAFDRLCRLIKENLLANNYDRIEAIFSALLKDNDKDQIEDIIDQFKGTHRILLEDIATKAGNQMWRTESIFDMRMSRSDLQNNLRPGLSSSDLNYQHSLGNDRMVFWHPDIEELPLPEMKPLPKPLPTNLLKSTIISPESIQHVDNKVIESLQSDPTTFTELVAFLTQDCSKDVEKVRALFRWITMYDMKHLNFDSAAPNETLIAVLRAVKGGQMSYNELFYRMCRYAGIHCQFICGYSKGAGYRPGMTIKDNRMFRNVWTAVYVAGAWRFVNCNWGARYLTSDHHEPAQLGTLSSNANILRSIENRYRCDEFYFLTDPKQHIFEHFPDKKRWQLLNRPLTLDQFMALPILKSPFFNANLSLKRSYPETLLTKNGKVTVKINMPKAIGISCRLENRADNSILRGVTLVQVLDNHMIMVSAAPSQPGKFYLSIYVSDDWKSEEGREMACSFQVHCAEHNYDRLVTGRFPEVGVLGSTPVAQNLGVVVNVGVDPFVIWDERAIMKLNLVMGPGLRISHQMMSYDRSGQNSSPCDSYALLQFQGQGRSQYHLRFPINAFYCLTIFAVADDPHIPETEPMECIYRLLVDCRRAQDGILPFPRQTSRWVGFKLLEPLSQGLELNKVYRFQILSTNCSSVSVVINGSSWHDLSVTGDGSWKGKVNTGQQYGSLSVYCKFGTNPDDDAFIKLLDYVLIDPKSK